MNNRTKKSRGMAGVLGLLVALVMILSTVIPVYAIPQMPNQFYGTVTIGGVQAPEGTVIEAKIGTIVYASTTVDSTGKYGYVSPLFRVAADDPDTTTIKEGGVSGEIIQFYIAGTAAQTTTFLNSPPASQLNLSISAFAATVTGITPSSGPTAGGTSVTITGTNFVSSATVTIGGVSATDVVYVSATSITAKTPAGTAGAKDVVVTVTGGTGTLTGGFTYIAAPVITVVVTTSITGTTANITWTTNRAATSLVEYGTTTAYGSSTTLDTIKVTSHNVALSGLTAETLYHYRVKSKDEFNVETVSADNTFTTLDIVIPVISAIATSGITDMSVTITWTTNETATSQVEYGTTTAYGSSTTLDATKVTSHSVVISGLTGGTLYHYRVKSKDVANNEAISADGTFTTVDNIAPVISAVATSNLAATSVTITWTTNEPSTSLVEYGTTTAYGSSTTLDTTMVTNHSVNITGLTLGTTYNYRVKSKDASTNESVSGNGTFVTPTDTTAPVISAVASGTITGSEATITWTTSEASTSLVEYGTTTAYGTSTTLDSTKVTSHSVVLTGLTGGTLYHYRVKSKDAANNEVVSADSTFTTIDNVAPVISAVATSNLTSTTVTITWTTSEASTSLVEYGTTTAYGTSTTLDSTKVTSHSVVITGLTASTMYNYRVKSKDAANNEAVSANNTFTTTAPPDTTAPVITVVLAGSLTTTGATITWTTSEASTSLVEYGTTTAYGTSTTLDSTKVTSHSVVITGLTAGTTYNFRVKSKDAANNEGVSANSTFTTTTPPDTTAPVITAVVSGSLTATGATITWTTNEASTSLVEYGTTTAYGSSTTLNSTMVTSHSVVLSGLTASTTYNYRVKSKDAAGNEAVSANSTFTAITPPDTTAPVITVVQSGSLTTTGVTITWTTSEASTSMVEYGTTTSYGSSTTLDSTKVTSHSVVITGLTAGTTYNFRVKSKDAANNEGVSANNTFKTTAKSGCGSTKIGDLAMLLGLVGAVFVVGLKKRK